MLRDAFVYSGNRYPTQTLQANSTVEKPAEPLIGYLRNSIEKFTAGQNGTAAPLRDPDCP